MIDTAKTFWMSRKRYPSFTCNFQRRYLDLGIILKYIDDTNSILDLGCGEGQNLLMLRELTDIKDYYAYDLSSVFIDNLIKRWGNCSGLNAEVVDFTIIDDIPKVDMCICMGVMLYIIDDNDLKHILSSICSRSFICRVPCSLERNRVVIDKFSEEHGYEYAAVYRTVPEYMSILSEFFDIKSIDRCYPDEIESKYGTKQFFFVCEHEGDV